MKQILRPLALAAAFVAAAACNTLAHPDRGEKLPAGPMRKRSFSMTGEEAKREPEFRHPPGNVRAEDMYELFAGNVLVVDKGRKYSTIGAPNHALKVIFLAPNGRYLWCSVGDDPNYYSNGLIY